MSSAVPRLPTKATLSDPKLSHETNHMETAFCVDARVHVCAHPCVHGGQTLTSFLRCLPPCIFKTMASRCSRGALFDQRGCLARPGYLPITASLPRDCKCATYPHPLCSKRIWALNSDSFACMASIFLTQPAHHPSELISRRSRGSQ